MMKQKILITAVAALLAMGGCSNNTHGVGATSSTSESTGASSGSIISRIKALVVGKSAKASIHMPAQALINDALTGGRGTNPGMLRMAYSYSWKVLDGNAGFEQAKEQLSKLAEEKGDQVLRAALKAGDTAKARDRYLHNILMMPLGVAAAPFNGWETNPMSNAVRDKKETENYLQSMEAAVIFANTIYTEIASKLAADVMADPEAAKAAIKEAYYAIPLATLKAAWEQAKAEGATSGRSIDLAGSGNVHWIKGSRDFVGDSAGLVLTQNGVEWFGKGKLSGKGWEFGLESSISKTMSKQETTQAGTDSSTGRKTDAGAGAR